MSEGLRFVGKTVAEVEQILAEEAAESWADIPSVTLTEIPSDALTVAIEAARELTRARAKFHAFAGPHEGYAVILEELDELWDLVKGFPKRASTGQMRGEAIQVAAMALRFIVDVCDAEKPA